MEKRYDHKLDFEQRQAASRLVEEMTEADDLAPFAAMIIGMDSKISALEAENARLREERLAFATEAEELRDAESAEASAIERVCAQDKVLDEVRAERARQDAKWGEQNHRPFTYLTVLMEEVGEAAQAALSLTYGGNDLPGAGRDEEYRAVRAHDYRSEMVQVAAVAIAMIEALDRGKDCDCPGCGARTIEQRAMM